MLAKLVYLMKSIKENNLYGSTIETIIIGNKDQDQFVTQHANSKLNEKVR